MIALPAPRAALHDYVFSDNITAERPDPEVKSWTCPACHLTVTGNAATRRAAIKRHSRNHNGTALPGRPPAPRRKR